MCKKHHCGTKNKRKLLSQLTHEYGFKGSSWIKPRNSNMELIKLWRMVTHIGPDYQKGP